MDADLRRYYNADLPDLRAGRLSPFRVAAWVEHLPPDSALSRATGHGWRVADYLLAQLIDEARAANWQRGNEGAKTPTKAPAPIWRPGDKAKARELTVVDFKTFAERHRR